MAFYTNPDGSIAVRSDGKIMTAPTQQEYDDCCCGGPTNDCSACTENCDDGVSSITATMDYVKEGADDTCDFYFANPLVLSANGGCNWAYDAGGFILSTLKCITNQWVFEIEVLELPPHCYGIAYPELICASGQYPTGTFTINIFRGAVLTGTATVVLS